MCLLVAFQQVYLSFAQLRGGTCTSGGRRKGQGPANKGRANAHSPWPPHEDHEDGLALSLIGDDVRGVGPDHAGTRQRDRHDVGSAAELIMAARLSKRLG